jgi:hypothetical protein
MSIRQILNIDSFDPLEIDVSFLENVSGKIPQEGYNNNNLAKLLLSKDFPVGINL